jgi:NADP-dependent 3-hydroxy acid dehydrogenase YdfG
MMAGLLDNKVVVISGVGPALGTTLARRRAEAGADLVLAARTVERLDDVAKQITDLGGAPWRCPPTSPTRRR